VSTHLDEEHVSVYVPTTPNPTSGYFIMLPKSEGITELKKLKSAFKSLAQKLNDWQEKLIQLKDEATYKTIASIENWDFYFEEKRTILLKQLERLKESNQLHFENNQTVDSE